MRHLAGFGDISDDHNLGWGWLLSSRVERPEVLLNALQCTAPTTKNYLVRNVEKPLSSTETDRKRRGTGGKEGEVGRLDLGPAGLELQSWL